MIINRKEKRGMKKEEKDRKKERSPEMTEGIKITKEKFAAYLKVQKSGLTNMFEIDTVIEIAATDFGTELTKAECIHIMNRYSTFKEKYK